jgi:hypothetical protein
VDAAGRRQRRRRCRKGAVSARCSHVNGFVRSGQPDESGFEGMATMRGRSMERPRQYRGRVGRASRSFDCQLEVVPVDLDLT